MSAVLAEVRWMKMTRFFYTCSRGGNRHEAILILGVQHSFALLISIDDRRLSFGKLTEINLCGLVENLTARRKQKASNVASRRL